MDGGLWHHTGGIDQPPPRKRNAKKQNGCLLVSSVTQLWCHGLQHASPPYSSPTLGAWSNSHPLSQWCHPTISSSVIHLSSSLQSFPESGFFSMSPYFTSDGQSIGVSASESVLPMNIQDWFPVGLTDWFPVGLTGLISLQSKGLSRVFSNTTVQKHQFFGCQLSFFFLFLVRCLFYETQHW